MYWEELLNEFELPDSELSTILIDYFEWQKFTYDTWLENHPVTHQQPASITREIPQVKVDEDLGM
jgi:hypothetical protein